MSFEVRCRERVSARYIRFSRENIVGSAEPKGTTTDRFLLYGVTARLGDGWPENVSRTNTYENILSITVSHSGPAVRLS